MKIFGVDIGFGVKNGLQNTMPETRTNLFRWKQRARDEVGVNVRGFDAAKSNNLNADWYSPTTSINSLLASQLRTIRARCRERSRNDDYAKAFIKMCVSNLVGQTGIRIQCMATDLTGNRDAPAIKAVEDAWDKWSKYPANVDIAGRNNWKASLELMVRNWATDGEVFIRHIIGSEAGDYGYRIQVIDPALCDETYNAKLENGNTVVMGVEMNEWGRPVAYHFLSKTDNSLASSTKAHKRIPAEEITHAFQQEYADQVRGIPPMAVTIGRLKMLSGFEEAALTNARAGAAKMGFFTRPDNSVDPANKVEADGELIEEMVPASMTLLPEGYGFQSFDARYPDGEIEPFKKAMLRATAAGLGVSYFDLAQDLESVNLSSARVAINETRENWKSVQQFIVDSIVTPVYERWLEQALLRKMIVLSPKKVALSILNIDKYKEVQWLPRRWQHADPSRDAQSQILLVNNRIKSMSSVAAEIGIDFETEIELIARDEELLQQFGLTRLDKQSSPNDPALIQDDKEEITE